MKKYIVEISETAEQDLENIISYLRFSLAGDIIADKYKILFKQELKNLENSIMNYQIKWIELNVRIYLKKFIRIPILRYTKSIHMRTYAVCLTGIRTWMRRILAAIIMTATRKRFRYLLIIIKRKMQLLMKIVLYQRVI